MYFLFVLYALMQDYTISCRVNILFFMIRVLFNEK